MPYNEKAACTLGGATCRLLFFWECRVGIYAYAGAGCLRARTRACVPHTPYTLVLKFVPSAGRVCGAATHAVGRGAGYGLLKSRLKPVRRLSDDLSFSKTTRGQSPRYGWPNVSPLQNSCAENAKRSQLIIATTSGVGRILESDILGIAPMNCNDGSVKGFVGYKYPTYACWVFQVAFEAV